MRTRHEFLFIYVLQCLIFRCSVGINLMSPRIEERRQEEFRRLELVDFWKRILFFSDQRAEIVPLEVLSVLTLKGKYLCYSFFLSLSCRFLPALSLPTPPKPSLSTLVYTFPTFHLNVWHHLSMSRSV